jgi:hypothetical protein
MRKLSHVRSCVGGDPRAMDREVVEEEDAMTTKGGRVVIVLGFPM